MTTFNFAVPRDISEFLNNTTSVPRHFAHHFMEIAVDSARTIAEEGDGEEGALVVNADVIKEFAENYVDQHLDELKRVIMAAIKDAKIKEKVTFEIS